MNNDDTKQNPAKDWPDTVTSRDELDAALEAGLKSGPSQRSFDEIIEQAKIKLDNG